jgi:hypothetical protein
VFEIKITKDPTLILERNKAEKTAKLHQTTYIKTAIDELNLGDCNPSDTPMESGILENIRKQLQEKIGKQGREPELLRKLGKLMWLKTRPDVTFATCLMTRFANRAGTPEIKTVNRIFKYLAANPERGIVINGNNPWEIIAYCDSDWGGDPKTCKSTSGIYFTLCGATIPNCSKLQRKIADSAGMAETIAAHACCREAIFIKGITTELGLPIQGPIKIFVDNNGVIAQSKNALDHKSSKHYRIPQAMIRELEDSGIVDFKKVDTIYNGADVLTKPLGKELHRRHTTSIMGAQ